MGILKLYQNLDWVNIQGWKVSLYITRDNNSPMHLRTNKVWWPTQWERSVKWKESIALFTSQEHCRGAQCDKWKKREVILKLLEQLYQLPWISSLKEDSMSEEDTEVCIVQHAKSRSSLDRVRERILPKKPLLGISITLIILAIINIIMQVRIFPSMGGW